MCERYRKGIIDGIETVQEISSVKNDWTNFDRWRPFSGSDYSHMSSTLILLRLVESREDGTEYAHWLVNWYGEDKGFKLLQNYAWYDSNAGGWIDRGWEFINPPILEDNKHDVYEWKYVY